MESVLQPPVRRADKFLVTLMIAFGLLLAGLAFLDKGSKGVLLVLLGVSLGAVFMGFQYGFASGWRRFIEAGDSRHLSLHFLLSFLCALVFIPAAQLGLTASGTVAPVSGSLIIGAFIFGIGMQLANGCGSGVLFTFGGGSGRMLVALPFFVIGSVIGSLLLPPLLGFASLGQIEIGGSLPWGARLGVNLLLLGGVSFLCYRHSLKQGLSLPRKAVAATLVIALLCWGVFIVSGHPWGVTFGFTLWGAKLVAATGLPIEQAAFWQWPGPARALTHSVFSDTSSLMDFAMIIGAGSLAALSGAFGRSTWPNRRQLVAAAIGGIVMGIGARLSFGCNIGAFLAGTASGSLHGWLWFVAAMAGSVIGIKARPHFGF